jgi:hypothetical protein
MALSRIVAAEPEIEVEVVALVAGKKLCGYLDLAKYSLRPFIDHQIRISVLSLAIHTRLKVALTCRNIQQFGEPPRV